MTPVHFNSNGSRAERLAIILNQTELNKLGGSLDMSEAAQRLLQVDRAQAVVVKCGAKGAWVYVAGADPHFVPAFRSMRVFKIGTGDVFTGVFAHYWCERGENAVQAAMAASEAVSFYAETRRLKIAADQREPVRSTNVRVSVFSSGVTLADRLLREEARSALISLGAELVELPSSSLNPDAGIDSALVLADGDPRISLSFVQRARLAGVPTVVFREKGRLPSSKSAKTFYSDDFSTAIYHTFWVPSLCGKSFSTTKTEHRGPVG
ncbi:carbohydrate kinase family protein [Bradyrhizobium septentrionale]|uniref:carbohydrate kinase family protein n=1 Tax=Bradyrhizobium septentrionale TaxID=1404411 RepID=UPI001596B6B0|nr:carbohydrate kinase family protein [Bradyrhizobium septentrionale]UGY26655.1 carbohydrate kinase family protein [Bradyrhizobium septentrionale]